MDKRISQSSPRRLARLAGVFLLLTIAGGIFAQAFVSDRLIVGTDAAATATNILKNKTLFRISFAVFLVEMACQVATSVFFYQLLKVVNRTGALLALSLAMTGSIIKTFARVFYIAPLFVLDGPGVWNGFGPEQLQSLALLLLKLNSRGSATALVFFGFSTALNGYLILRSTFLPRWLGTLSLIGGLGWVTFLYPVGPPQFLIVVTFALVSCALQIFWLMAFGVNEERWKERALVAAQVAGSS